MHAALSRLLHFVSLSALLIIAGCGTSGYVPGKGGYYEDDGPDSRPPSASQLERIPDATPRVEPLASGPNRPYTVLGRSYTPDTSGRPYVKRGIASWYGKKFHGNKTSNGEIYDMYAMTAAHPTLPIPSYVRVTRTSSGKSVVLRVNDRGPFHADRIIDLSYVAAHKLDLIGPGSGEVVVEWISPDAIRNGAWQQAGNTAQATGNSYQDDPPIASISLAAPVSTPIAQDSGVQQGTPLPAPERRPEPVATPQATPATASPRAAIAGGYEVQLGAFSQHINAQRLVDRIQPYLPAGSQTAYVDDSTGLHRVRIGPYSNLGQAQEASRQVADRIGMPAIVISP
ncbi:septal ring lytic transglycosylase RlpA family protein [Corticimicrobacter populi]|uniref:Endolytic peptidoglycan transglycosylase RlpA n=1 Tax=Corticimicrobacter populi TaxID=2175229 RepID=A0A2V1JYA6_9BURK|nr:septal ring lytic transglycosylase RlpA family protein [Corticimicrobacter populi]PWF23872.1 septal ring lytic transglycosylase RlpA family lipoprotein [Corticimicrobacter populi]